MGRVRNVVLIKSILDLGKPKRGWNLGGRVHGPGEEQGELVYEQPDTEGGRFLSQLGGFQVSRRRHKGRERGFDKGR